MTDILIADDETEPRDSVVEMLEDEGYAVRVAKDGGEALALYAEQRPDLLLLDVKMPVKTGWDVCREVRRMDKSLPIILLTSFGEEDDKVRGLTIGADDYIVKDCGARELLARVKRQLGRVVQIAAEQSRAAQASSEPPPSASPDGDAFAFGAHHTVDPKRFVLLDGRRRETKLSKRELAVLRHFADHPNEVVEKEELLRRFWGMDNLERIESRVHDTLIWGLREKLGGDKDAIETVHGIGWRYRA